jgi:hypothetical protein
MASPNPSGGGALDKDYLRVFSANVIGLRGQRRKRGKEIYKLFAPLFLLFSFQMGAF